MPTINQPIRCSVGRSMYDNKPEQMEFGNIVEFTYWLSEKSNWSNKKGERYICAPMEKGFHNNTEKYSEEAHWRLKSLVLPMRFACFDLDGFNTVSVFKAVITYLNSRYSGLFYTTASCTREEPRCRVILELDRDIGCDDLIIVCRAIEHEIKRKFGADAVKFDSSVYGGWQPCYTPTVGAKFAYLNGMPVCVNAVLSFKKHIRKLSTRKKKSVVSILTRRLANNAPPEETPENIAKVKLMLSKIPADCDYTIWRNICWGVLDTDWHCAEQILDEWSQSSYADYDESIFQKVINSYDSDRLDRVGYGTFIMNAKKYAAKPKVES